MRKIISLFPIDDSQIRLKFDDGTEKQFDLKPYFHLPVFSNLKDIHLFRKMNNRVYFIEWEGQEIDLSADTLWHKGKSIYGIH